MRIVALEEHFVVPEIVSALQRTGYDLPVIGAGDDPLSRHLRDTGEERIAAMDDQGVDVQVLSLNSPGAQALPAADAVAVSRDANDALADVVKAHPDRFQGFASLPTADPAAATAELERAIGALGFPGALINGRTGTTNADAARFDDLYGAAARLGAPLYLHPQTPVAPVRDAYYSGFGAETDQSLANFGIGWHYEAGMQVLRMVLAGVFDRHPDLHVVIGHWGEVVLFFLERVQSMTAGLHLQRPIDEVFRENVWVTGSGMLTDRYLRWAVEVVGADHVLSATDYPFVDNSGGAARRFLEQAPLTDAEKAAIGSGGWEALTAR